MRIQYIPNYFDKKNRKVVEVVNPQRLTAAEWLDYAVDRDKKGLVCVVNGKVVDWAHIPTKDDDVIFVQDIGELSTWVMVIMMVVSMAMSFVMSMLMKPKVDKQKDNQDSKTYSWDGIKNIIGDGSTVPIVYGRHRVGGCVIEGFIDGDITNGIQAKKYLNALMAVSEGEIHAIDTNTIKIGNTEATSFASDAQSWTRMGTISQTAIDNFSKVHRYYSITGNIQLTNSGGGYVYKTFNHCNSAKVCVSFDSLFHMNNEGNMESKSVSIGIYYASESEPNDFTYYGSYPATASNQSSFEHEITVQFPTKGVYYIRIERQTADFLVANGDYGNTYLKSIVETENAKLSYPSTALLGVRLTATDKISGTMPDVTVIVDGKKVRDVRNLTAEPSLDHYQNPANIVYDLLTDELYGLGLYVKAEQIDLASFQEFANWCDERVNYEEWNPNLGVYETKSHKRYEFNIVLDEAKRSAEIISRIVESCRSILYWSGSKIRISVDKPTDTITQMFTMSNIVADSFEESYIGLSDIPGQVEITILDADDDYKKTTIVAVDKSRVDEATESKSIELYGFTDKVRAKREALYAMKKLRATKKTIKFASSIQAIICEVGDLILFQHDIPQYGFGGHVVSAGTNTVTVNVPLTLVANHSYRLRIRRKDNTYVLYTIAPTQTVTTSTIDCGMAVDINIARGDIFQFGEIISGTSMEAKPFRVTSISKGEEYKVNIEAEEYNASVYDEDETVEIKEINYSALGTVAQYNVNGIEPNPDNRTATDETIINSNPNSNNDIPPFVTSISLSEELLLVGNVYQSNIVGGFTPVAMPANSLAAITKYMVIYSTDGGNSWTQAGMATSNTFRIQNAVIGLTYHVLVKPITNYQVTNQVEASAYKLNFHITIAGKTAAPSAPTSLTATPASLLNNITWGAVADGDIDRYELWCSATTNDRAIATRIYAGKNTSYEHNNVQAGTVYYYWVMTVDTAGNPSAWYPVSATGGVACTASNSPSRVLAILQNQIGESQLTEELMNTINSSAGIQAVETLLENQWTVKINENNHVAGVGMVMYPEYSGATTYATGYTVEASNGLLYKSLADNNLGHEPSASPTYWSQIENGVKSQFVIVANQFAVVNPGSSTDIKAPFIVGTVDNVSTVGINGNLMVDGTIGANKIKTDELVVGQNITMGENATLSWSQITGSNKPADGATSDLSLVPRGGCVARGNVITKTTGTNGAWDSDCYSRDGYTGGAYCSFIPNQNNQHLMVGLNTDPITDLNYTSIDYAWNAASDGIARIYENGVSQGSFGAYTTSDVFSIVYDGSKIVYMINGLVMRTVTPSTTNLKFYLDSSFYNIGASVKNVRFGPVSSNNWSSIGGAGKPANNADVSKDNTFVPYKTWEFQNSVDGWRQTNITFTQNADSLTLTATTADPEFRSPTISVNGSLYSIIRVRIRRTAGSGWQGYCFYTTASHGESSSYYKHIEQPVLLETAGLWATLEFDMSTLNAGGTDWTTNTITSFRLDFGCTQYDVFEVDSVSIGKRGDTVLWCGMTGRPANLSALTGTEVINNGSIYIDAEGKLRGIGTGAGIVVDNSLVEVDTSNLMEINPTTPTSIGANWLYTGTIAAGQVTAGTLTGFTITGGTVQTTDGRTKMSGNLITVQDEAAVVRVKLGYLG